MKEIEGINVALRKAEISDFECFYKIKAEDNNIFWTGYSEKPDHSELYNWYSNTLKSNQKRSVYIIVYEDKSVGYMYADKIFDNVFELSISVSDEYAGRRIASNAIKKLIDEYSGTIGKIKFEAWIREDNIASQKAFKNAGFTEDQEYKEYWIEGLKANLKMIKFVKGI